MINTIALEEYLKPLEKFLNDNSISEILINQPETVFIERHGLFETYEMPTLNIRHLLGLANLIARYTDQRLSEKEPLLSGHLPNGNRIQIIFPPATKAGQIVLCIRKQKINDLTLEDFEKENFFTFTKIDYLNHDKKIKQKSDDLSLELLNLLHQKKFISFLKLAILNKKNILISGGTSTGKTTFLNACLKEIPIYEHLVTLEDVPEIKTTHPLLTSLFASKGLQGLSQVTMQDLVQASLRLRPDRIIMGELRGAEAADFINATATGHDGSLSSIHASSPYLAFMRLVHMVKLSGTNLSKENILEDLHSIVDIVVQLRKRIENKRCTREVTEIYYINS